MAPSELVTSDPARRHRLIADGFARRVHGATNWSAAAPVSGWAARDVVIHLVEWLPGFVAALVAGFGIQIWFIAGLSRANKGV